MKLLNKKSILVTLSCIVSVSIVAWLVYDAKDSFIKIWNEVNTLYLILACLSSAAIYVCMGLSLWETLKLLGQKINLENNKISDN